ncbi:MAG: GNAT family N-acetyltransferase [Bullifex sp.]
MTIRKLTEAEPDDALSLVWDVFLETEGLSYTEKGKTRFHDAIHDEAYISSLTIWGAFEQELCGIIASRSGGSQISLFFVRAEYRGKGTGRMLFDALLADTFHPYLNVHSSLYAEAVYEHFGFRRMSDPVTEDGITYVPMCFDVLMHRLTDKDNVRAFAFAEKVVSMSESSDIWSRQVNRLTPLLADKSAFVRIRVAMIITSQARWIPLDDVLPELLKLLHDKKPSAVRQCLSLLASLIKEHPRYTDSVIKEVRSMDLSAYPDTMRPLIEKDIAVLFHF